MTNQSPELTNFNEWTEWNLTPRGWERGSQKFSSPADRVQEVEVPLDSVLTCRYLQNLSINSVWLQKHVTEIWKCSDQEMVAELLEKFGDCPQNL